MAFEFGEEDSRNSKEKSLRKEAGKGNKKEQYLKQKIEDKNGHFSYERDPVEYKKARKRMQNRESAVRSRQRKREYQGDLEGRINELEAS